MTPRPSLAILASVLAAAWIAPAQAQCTANCSNLPTGLVPLTDLPGAVPNTYLGAKGGLYPQEQNVLPAAHLAAGLAEAAKIEPLDAAGGPDDCGRIVMLSIGMSVTRQSFEGFRNLYSDRDPNRNPALLLVNGTTGGQMVSDWAAAPVSPVGIGSLWDNADASLEASGVTPAQVQVAYVMMIGNEVDAGVLVPFPTNMLVYRDQLMTVLMNLRTRYPNCRMAYLGSHPYLGWSSVTAAADFRQEPTAYENAFATKWTIEQQIRGHQDLAFGDLPAAKAPWVAWGPYLWADGIDTSVESCGDLAGWYCGDFGDCVHLSPAGACKVAKKLNAFFTTDATTTPWYYGVPPANPACSTPDVALAWWYGEECPGAFTAPYSGTFTRPAPCTAFGTGPSVPYLDNQCFTVRFFRVPPLAPAHFLVSLPPLGFAPPTDCCSAACGFQVDPANFLDLMSTTSAAGTGGWGSAEQLLEVSNDPVLVGVELLGQWLVDDPAGSLQLGTSTFTASKGLWMRIGLP